MGPLKIISDGSLNTLTAWCCEPYLEEDLLDTSSGAPNLDLEELVPIMARARALGVTAAIHAIGDAAVAATLDAFEASGQIGTMEHAQLRPVVRPAADGASARQRQCAAGARPG
jgi:predicted amidohydrolase YtcJ